MTPTNETPLDSSKTALQILGESAPQQATGVIPAPTPANSVTEDTDKKEANTTTATITFSTPIHNALLREAQKCGLRTVPDFLRSLVAFAVRMPDGVNLNLTIEEDKTQPEFNLTA